MQLSEHFSLSQLIASETADARGIDNTPPVELLHNLQRLAAGLEQIRALIGCELEISSGYRGPSLNRAVGGTEGSQHMRGEAADFSAAAFGTPLEVCRAIAASSIAFDQLIHEYGDKPSGGWVHVSFSAEPRRRVLTICVGDREYRDGLIDCRALRKL